MPPASSTAIKKMRQDATKARRTAGSRAVELADLRHGHDAIATTVTAHSISSHFRPMAEGHRQELLDFVSARHAWVGRTVKTLPRIRRATAADLVQ